MGVDESNTNDKYINIVCTKCGTKHNIKRMSIYRQYVRHTDANGYTCKSCSAKASWNKNDKKSEVSDKSRKMWKNTDYAILVKSKAISRSIIEKSQQELDKLIG